MPEVDNSKPESKESDVYMPEDFSPQQPSGADIFAQIQQQRQAVQQAMYLLNGLQQQIDDKGNDLKDIAARIKKASKKSSKVLDKLRKEALMCGEALMKLLENLDGVSMHGDDEVRSKRKVAVAQANVYLEDADKLGLS